MKEQKLLIVISTIGLMSGGITGCHKPVKSTVVLPDSQATAPAIYAGAGGALEFRTETNSGLAFNVTFEPNNPCESKDGSPLASQLANVGKDKASGKDIMIQSATCHIRKDADDKYTFSINYPGQAQANQPAAAPLQPQSNATRVQNPVGTFYVRPCPTGCTHSSKTAKPKKSPKTK